MGRSTATSILAAVALSAAAVAAPAAATSPPEGVATATAAPEQIQRLIDAAGAPNNFCAFTGVYFQAAVSDAARDAAGLNAELGRLAPAMGALAADVVAHPPAGLPDMYVPVARDWVSLFGQVVDHLRSQGVTDEQVQALIAAAPGFPADVDEAAYQAAVASSDIDLAKSLDAVTSAAESAEPEGFDVKDFCPNLQAALGALDTTDAGVLVSMLRAGNSFCAMGSLLTIAAFGSFGGTPPKQTFAPLAPALLALSKDVVANPPDNLPAGVLPEVEKLAQTMGEVVDQLKAAGLTDADLAQMMQSVLVGSDDDATDGSGVPSTDPAKARIAAAIDSVTVDIAGALQSEGESVDLKTVCPDLDLPAS